MDEADVESNENNNINYPIDVFPTKNNEIKAMVIRVCACLNSKQRRKHETKLVFNILEKTTSKIFDNWYREFETKLMQFFSKPISDFITRKGDCDSNQLQLIVKKSTVLCSLHTYLYIPTASSVFEAYADDAVAILMHKGEPGQLPEPVKKRIFQMHEIVENLRLENVDVQFKTVTKEDVGKGITNHFKFISAFANKDGGSIYFGIEDNNGRVVGVNTTMITEIEKSIKNKFSHMIMATGHTEGKTLERGVHWEIDYNHIEADDTSKWYVAKYKSKYLKCKSGDILERLSLDGKGLGTFKKTDQDIGFVHVSSVSECFRYEADSPYKSIEQGEVVTSFSDVADKAGFVLCMKANGSEEKIPLKFIARKDGEWFKYNSQTPAPGKGKQPQMSYEKGEVLEQVRVLKEDSDKSVWYQMKSIDKKETTVPKTHLKKLLIGKGPQKGDQTIDTEDRNIIVIRVAKIPGGVLTACPESYYATEDGRIKQYKFHRWKEAMRKVRTEPCNIEIWDTDANLVYTENDGKLKDFMSKHKCVIIKGLMGTGKTSLALQYCYNFKEENPSSVVWKLHCSDLNEFNKSMYQLRHHLLNTGNVEMSCYKEIDRVQVENDILKQLSNRKHESHLLLLDDVHNRSRESVQNFSENCMKVDNINIIMTTCLMVSITDSGILDIKGLSPTESSYFLQIGPKQLEDECEILAQMFCLNPQAMHMGKTYMSKAHLTIEGMTEFLQSPFQWYTTEKSKVIRDDNKRKTPFRALVQIICQLEKNYENINYIFTMLLMLRYLKEQHKIPVILFGTVFDNSKVNEFVSEVEDISFGTVEGTDDDRMLSVHDMVVVALDKFLLKKKKEFPESQLKVKLLKILMKSFFLSMDKDSNSEKDLSRHEALIPHACKVIDIVNKLTETEKNAIRGTEFDLHLIYVSDVINYMKSVKLNRSSYCENVLKMIFNLLGTTDPFERINTEGNSGFHTVANNILIYIENFLSHKCNFTVVEKVGLDYLLHKYRNRQDRKCLCKVLSKQHLIKGSQLSESEYIFLSKNSLAVPKTDIGPLFLYELIISILHSCVKESHCRRAESYLSLNSTEAYLNVAYIISTKITPGKMYHLERQNNRNMRQDYFQFIVEKMAYLLARIPRHRMFKLNSIATILTERLLLKIGRKEIPEKAETVISIKQDIDMCKERLNETTCYLEFGVLKLDTKVCELSAFTWMEYIISLSSKLAKVDDLSSLNRVKVECKSLKTKIERMQENAYKWKLQISLGKLYFEVEEFELAEELFKLLLPDIKVIQNNFRPNFSNFELTSSVYYIRCRIKRQCKDHNYYIETQSMLETFLVCAKFNDDITKELQSLRPDLEIAKEPYSTWNKSRNVVDYNDN